MLFRSIVIMLISVPVGVIIALSLLSLYFKIDIVSPSLLLVVPIYVVLVFLIAKFWVPKQEG